MGTAARNRGWKPLLRYYWQQSRLEAAPTLLLAAIAAGSRSYVTIGRIVGAATRRDIQAFQVEITSF
jgi:hypothetical protein